MKCFPSHARRADKGFFEMKKVLLLGAVVSCAASAAETQSAELGLGPLPVLTERIDRFIAEGGKGPYPDME
jgi:hypothetical protein